ncbi:hypothetical protein FA09DRAFT_343830 [Tilletiopsis washingtonensis]|uniref:mRNA guanylyltransferase n=1 Tax=Tilletiopsis washingtonensis TaxID=58919 RepID=A0A316Z5R0_9BASI|nr:hypothetical protein FA09DRAFT_343830 [Tilletiopsis washingtonensis]PWN96626.1 hypothetical protein FA09DRAFT_343830 [Tilletiopsis washingtonensis]
MPATSLPGPSGSVPQAVPDVPGARVDEQRSESLKAHVAKLCQLQHTRFPGAQPVSFTKASLDLLLTEDFWVCEKSDGQRVLVLIAWNKFAHRQEVFLIDRKNIYREQSRALFFPHFEKPRGKPEDRIVQDIGSRWKALHETVLDGELVWDTLKDGRRKLRLLLFDALVIDGQNMASRTLEKRYGRLQAYVYKPFVDFMRENPQRARDMDFEIFVKTMDLGYGIQAVLKDRIPRLEHGNDGLIFTCITSGYTCGTDSKIIKWKPPYENTIDFKLRLRFPPDLAVDPRGNVPDLSAKPFFALDQFVGRERGSTSDGYEYFDWLHVEDDEWEQMKASGQQFDDVVVEVSWDLKGGPLSADGEPTPGWRLHRVRDDKHDGNHHTIVQKIITSIEDGVEEDELVGAEQEMRRAWKSEERTRIRKAGLVQSRTEAPSRPEAPAGRRMGPGPPMRGVPPPGLKR